MKRTKADVSYENPAKIPAHHCGVCEHYVRGGSCQKVAGKIDPQAWCKLWEAKS